MMRGARLIQTTGPLAGASVVVTRPAATAATLRRGIRARGGDPIGLPASALRVAADAGAVKRALRAARGADVVIFISPAAVRFAFALDPGLRFTRATQVVAVGPGSARALARRGIDPVLRPATRHDSEGVLALPELRKLRGATAVVIGAPGGRGLIERELRARRARLTRIDVYQRATPAFTRRQLGQLERAPEPLLTLVSSAQALARLQTDLPLPLFARLAAGHLVVSSERLAALARASLFARVSIATGPSPQELLNAACAVIARHKL
jgi:uroporphyrinogen-III synthase